MSSINFSTSKKPMSAFSLAGLADIVLLLLIFFLLTSSFIPQFGIQVNLPRADSATSMDAKYLPVAVTAKGQFFVEGKFVPRERLLESIRNAVGTRTALVLRADEKATVGAFASVATIAKALNLRLLMATEHQRAGTE